MCIYYFIIFCMKCFCFISKVIGSVKVYFYYYIDLNQFFFEIEDVFCVFFLGWGMWNIFVKYIFDILGDFYLWKL